MALEEESAPVQEGQSEEDASSAASTKASSAVDPHCTREYRNVKSGLHKGKMVVFFKCDYCPTSYQGPSTSTMMRHLRDQHPTKCPDLLKENTKATIKGPTGDFFSKPKKMKNFDPDVFVGKMVKWMIKRDHPFSEVENEFFREMLDYVHSELSLISRRTLMRRVDDIHEAMKVELKEELTKFKSKFSITCDLWTSLNCLSFFGITIHFIDDDWKMHERLLAFKHFEKLHDGKSLSEAVIEVLDDFGITERLLGVTADNASNNMKMMYYLEQHFKEKYPNSGFSVVWNQVECIAHVINLAAKQVLDRFKQPVDKENYEPVSDSCDQLVSAVSRLAFLVRKMRRSTKLRQIMKLKCEERGLPDLVPVIDVATRWNSTHDMLVRAVKLKDAFRDTFYSFMDNSLIKLLLTDEDWILIQKLIKVLSPLKEATNLVSKGSQAFMVTHVLPIFQFCIDSLKSQLNEFAEDDDIHIGISAAIEKLIHYYDKISPMVGIALLLNPCQKKPVFKDLLNWKDEWIDDMMESFRSSFKHYSHILGISDVNPVPTTIVAENEDELTYEYYRYKKRRMLKPVGDTMEVEYARYLNAPLEDDDKSFDILAYWKLHQSSYPILSVMAKDYLTVQASSVSAERAFSSGKDLVTPDRCSLSGKVIEKTQFIKLTIPTSQHSTKK
jgi:hypothetical protein